MSSKRKNKGNKGPPPRPKGMSKAEYKQKHARFFDNWFNTAGKQTNTSTTSSSVTVGGAGKRSRNLRNALVDISPDSGLESNSGGFIPVPQSLTSVTAGRANKGLIFEQKEMFAQVYGDAGITTSKAYPCNPALRSMFPKGANIADNYERYRVLSLEFLYVPLVSGMSPDGQQGRVVLSFGLDPLEAPPADLPAAESMDPNVAIMPFDRGNLPLNSAKLNAGVPFRWTRTSRNPAGTDLKTYDPGVLYVTVSGTTSGQVIGELHVVYRWELLNIRVGAAPALPNNNTYSVFRTTSAGFVTGVLTLGNIDLTATGYAPLDKGKNGMGIELDNTTLSPYNVIILPPGRFMVTLVGQATDSAAQLSNLRWGFMLGTVGQVPAYALSAPFMFSDNKGIAGVTQSVTNEGTGSCFGVVDSDGTALLVPMSLCVVSSGTTGRVTMWITIQTA